MTGNVVFMTAFLLDQEVTLLRQSKVLMQYFCPWNPGWLGTGAPFEGQRCNRKLLRGRAIYEAAFLSAQGDQPYLSLNDDLGSFMLTSVFLLSAVHESPHHLL